jgi:hypothetical protein
MKKLNCLNYLNTERVKHISVHVPTHLKPANETEFGHYLAGLIEGDGHFSSAQQLVIVFNSLDASLAYYIKKRIGYGSVTKLKSKNVILLTICKREGLEKVLNLVNGKLRLQFHIDAINKHIINAYKEPLKIKDKLHLNTTTDLNNH